MSVIGRFGWGPEHRAALAWLPASGAWRLRTAETPLAITDLIIHFPHCIEISRNGCATSYRLTKDGRAIRARLIVETPNHPIEG